MTTTTEPGARAKGAVTAHVLKRISALCEQRHGGDMKQASIAWGIGYDHAYKILRPSRSRAYFSPDVLLSIAEAEGVGLDWLFGVTNDTRDGRPVKGFARSVH